ncbi:MAG: exosortase/archaeosortase family protein [Dysgonomonas sp.]
MTSIKTKLYEFYELIKPFKNIIWFLLLFISIDFIWKLCIDESKSGEQVFLFGKEITSRIEPVCLWTAEVTHWIIVNVFGYSDFHINGTYIYFDNSIIINIIWECSGVKQMIMFGLLIALYYGPVKKKIWFIPLSMAFLYLINLVRLIGIVFITKGSFPDWFIPFNEWYNNTQWDNTKETYWKFSMDWFEFFHKDVFRWLYYNGIMFILWLIWEEAFNLPYQKAKQKLKEKNKEAVK